MPTGKKPAGKNANNSKVNSPKLRAMLDGGRGQTMLPPSFNRQPIMDRGAVEPPSMRPIDPNEHAVKLQQHQSSRALMTDPQKEEQDRMAAINVLSMFMGAGAPRGGMGAASHADDMLPPPALEGVADDALIQNQPVQRLPSDLAPELWKRPPVTQPKEIGPVEGTLTRNSPTLPESELLAPPSLVPDVTEFGSKLQNMPVMGGGGQGGQMGLPGTQNMRPPSMPTGALDNTLPSGTMLEPKSMLSMPPELGGSYAPGLAPTMQAPAPNIMQQGNAQMLAQFNKMSPEQQKMALLAALGMGGGAVGAGLGAGALIEQMFPPSPQQQPQGPIGVPLPRATQR